MENAANLGLFVAHKIVSNDAERIYAYMEKTQREIKLRISWLKMVKHELFLDLYLRYNMG